MPVREWLGDNCVSGKETKGLHREVINLHSSPPYIFPLPHATQIVLYIGVFFTTRAFETLQIYSEQSKINVTKSLSEVYSMNMKEDNRIVRN